MLSDPDLQLMTLRDSEVLAEMASCGQLTARLPRPLRKMTDR
jgi:hypothetical protein